MAIQVSYTGRAAFAYTMLAVAVMSVIAVGIVWAYAA